MGRTEQNASFIRYFAEIAMTAVLIPGFVFQLPEISSLIQIFKEQLSENKNDQNKAGVTFFGIAVIRRDEQTGEDRPVILTISETGIIFGEKDLYENLEGLLPQNLSYMAVQPEGNAIAFIGHAGEQAEIFKIDLGVNAGIKKIFGAYKTDAIYVKQSEINPGVLYSRIIGSGGGGQADQFRTSDWNGNNVGSESEVAGQEIEAAFNIIAWSDDHIWIKETTTGWVTDAGIGTDPELVQNGNFLVYSHLGNLWKKGLAYDPEPKGLGSGERFAPVAGFSGLLGIGEYEGQLYAVSEDGSQTALAGLETGRYSYRWPEAVPGWPGVDFRRENEKIFLPVICLLPGN